jgi:hypothetical protein
MTIEGLEGIRARAQTILDSPALAKYPKSPQKWNVQSGLIRAMAASSQVLADLRDEWPVGNKVADLEATVHDVFVSCLELVRK